MNNNFYCRFFSWKFRLANYGLLVLFFSCGVSFLADRQEWFSTLESGYYDLNHRLAGTRSMAQHTVIISLDNDSLELFPDTPLSFWGPHFAQAIRSLQELQTIVTGVDFLFAISPEDWLIQHGEERSSAERYNLPLREALGNGRVVLLGMAGEGRDGGVEFSLPVPDLIYALQNGPLDVGLGNLLQDSDGVIRKFRRALFPDSTPPYLTFASLLAAKAAIDSPAGDTLTDAVTARPEKIGFSGPPGTIPRISMARLLNSEIKTGSATAKLLEGRVAIISPDFSGANDLHRTPYSSRFFLGQGELMSGAELHANIIETLLGGRYPRAIMAGVVAAGSFLLLATAVVAGFLLTPAGGFIVAMVVAIAWAILAHLLFLFDWHLPQTGMQAGLVVATLGSLSFRLTDEARHRQALRELFSRYVGPQIVSRLLSSNQAVMLGGERKEVTGGGGRVPQRLSGQGMRGNCCRGGDG